MFLDQLQKLHLNLMNLQEYVERIQLKQLVFQHLDILYFDFDDNFYIDLVMYYLMQFLFITIEYMIQIYNNNYNEMIESYFLIKDVIFKNNNINIFIIIENSNINNTNNNDYLNNFILFENVYFISNFKSILYHKYPNEPNTFIEFNNCNWYNNNNNINKKLNSSFITI